MNKTSAAVAEAVACREKSSEQQLFLPFSALYINVCIKTSSSLSIPPPLRFYEWAMLSLIHPNTHTATLLHTHKTHYSRILLYVGTKQTHVARENISTRILGAVFTTLSFFFSFFFFYCRFQTKQLLSMHRRIVVYRYL